MSTEHPKALHLCPQIARLCPLSTPAVGGCILWTQDRKDRKSPGEGEVLPSPGLSTYQPVYHAAPVGSVGPRPGVEPGYVTVKATYAPAHCTRSARRTHHSEQCKKLPDLLDVARTGNLEELVPGIVGNDDLPRGQIESHEEY